MMIGQGQACYSTDRGRTWTKPEKLKENVKYAIRLQSSKLGGPCGKQFCISIDEGKTWEKRGNIQAGDVTGTPYDNTLIQTRSGRLILPVRFTSGAAHSGIEAKNTATGIINGVLKTIEGHAHFPEPDIAFVFYSDDEGKTWHKSEGGIMIWHQEGRGGMWPCDEPSVAGLENGELLMFCRTTLGRIYAARSAHTRESKNGKEIQIKPGQRFDQPQPTLLASSYSPAAVRRVPGTDDIMIIWNQVSGDEIRAGYRRGRLSSAITKDNGITWQHFRTIDASVLFPAGRVAPDPVPQMARGFDFVGVLPSDYGAVTYPTFEIVDDNVFVFWDRTVVDRRKEDVVGRRMKVFPLFFFYENEPEKKSTNVKVLLEMRKSGQTKQEAIEIPSKFYRGKIFCSSKDLEKHLKSPIGSLEKYIYAPLHQVITFLGWTPHYDCSDVKDPRDPRLVVTVESPYEKKH